MAPLTPAPGPRQLNWLLEIHVDRRWHEARRSPEPIPAPGRPRILALEGSSLVLGRGTALHAIDITLPGDNGISRRHARLDRVGQGWQVTDLDSHNGTWVAPDVTSLPRRPITSPTRLVSGSCVYLGSWTRLTLNSL